MNCNVYNIMIIIISICILFYKYLDGLFIVCVEVLPCHLYFLFCLFFYSDVHLIILVLSCLSLTPFTISIGCNITAMACFVLNQLCITY